MNSPFFITGLPRSRTAWLANFFTTQKAFCLHDGLKSGFSAAELAAQFTSLKSAGYHYVGDSDSALVLIVSDLVALFPNARWLFIRNTPERAATSFRKYFKPGEYPGIPFNANIEGLMDKIQTYYVAAQTWMPADQKLEVALDDLDRPETMRRVWNFLVPHSKFDLHRYRMLDTLRVNVIPQKISLVPPPPPENWKRETFYATQ